MIRRIALAMFELFNAMSCYGMVEDEAQEIADLVPQEGNWFTEQPKHVQFIQILGEKGCGWTSKYLRYSTPVVEGIIVHAIDKTARMVDVEFSDLEFTYNIHYNRLIDDGWSEYDAVRVTEYTAKLRGDYDSISPLFWVYIAQNVTVVQSTFDTTNLHLSEEE